MRTHHVRLARVAALGLGILALGCSSKIPFPEDLEGDPATRRPEGRAIVERAVAAHGGVDAWRSVGEARITYQDDWSWPLSVTSVQPAADVAVDLTFDYHGHRGRMTFPEHPGIVWTYRDAQGRVHEDGESADDEGATFLVPTVAYFFALPFKFLDPGVILEHAGTREHDGVEMDAVLVTFEEGVGAVQDRYIALFHPETHRLVWTAFTVYEQTSVGEGAASYTDWVDVDGLALPQRIDIGSVRPISAHVHTMEVGSYDLHPAIAAGTYDGP